MQIAKNPYEKFWEIFLTVFRDWEVHSQLSREGNRETVWVNSRLELPLTNQLPNRVAKMLKTQNFENFLSIFCDWGYDSPESREELLSKLTIRSTRLDWLVRVSRQNRVAKFLKFLNFFQSKNNFQKQLKHSKTHHNIWLFWINTSHFEIDAWNFWYFNLMSKPLAFWASYWWECKMSYCSPLMFSLLYLFGA